MCISVEHTFIHFLHEASNSYQTCSMYIPHPLLQTLGHFIPCSFQYTVYINLTIPCCLTYSLLNNPLITDSLLSCLYCDSQPGCVEASDVKWLRRLHSTSSSTLWDWPRKWSSCCIAILWIFTSQLSSVHPNG